LFKKAEKNATGIITLGSINVILFLLRGK